MKLKLDFDLGRMSSVKYVRIIFWFFGLLLIPVFAMIYGMVFTPICDMVSSPFHPGDENLGNITLGLSLASSVVTYYLLWRGLRRSLPG